MSHIDISNIGDEDWRSFLFYDRQGEVHEAMWIVVARKWVIYDFIEEDISYGEEPS